MNRVVLVTGACGGIGSVLCKRFVEQGDTVLALDVDEAALDALTVQLGDAHVTPVVADLGDAAAVQQAVAKAVALRGPVDVLVANAGAAQGLTQLAARCSSESERHVSHGGSGAGVDDRTATGCARVDRLGQWSRCARSSRL
jgi:NAD(P)-dependent dehydrogenase (short-subunit alcohol dehydrogenase family)